MGKLPGSSNGKPLRGPSGSREIGKLLTAARAREGVNQSQLARYLGVSKSAVSHWENGRMAIDSRHIAEISILLKIPVEHLMTLPAGAVFLTKEHAAMFKLFDRVPPARRQSLLAVLQSLVREHPDKDEPE